jgi:hypothetical protein
LRSIAVLVLALAPGLASAQGPDTLSISGTLDMDVMWGTLGADLEEVFTNGNAHGWVLTLYGVTYSHHFDSDEYGYELSWATFVSATSFDFMFIGPDADALNEVVSGLDGASLGLWNIQAYDSHSDGYYVYSEWTHSLSDRDTGTQFFCYGEPGLGSFSTDQSGYPAVEQKRLAARITTIRDRRPGNDGGLNSYDDLVDIGSAVPPVLPPSPPPPPALSIADGSVREGNKGTTRLNLEVTLSRSVTDVVTVRYATANGTALAKSDYTATSGTLTFQPGQTSRTIPISIKTDRKREPNETFTVQLSSAVGATIADGTATATILNDD